MSSGSRLFCQASRSKPTCPRAAPAAAAVSLIRFFFLLVLVFSYLCVYLYICLFVCLSVYPYFNLYFYSWIYLSIYSFVYLIFKVFLHCVYPSLSFCSYLFHTFTPYPRSLHLFLPVSIVPIFFSFSSSLFLSSFLSSHCHVIHTSRHHFLAVLSLLVRGRREKKKHELLGSRRKSILRILEIHFSNRTGKDISVRAIHHVLAD